MKVILIRYGELTLKGKNRKQFERQLFNNVQKQLSNFDLVFRKDHNRIYLEIKEISQYENIKAILKIIPGIHSFSIADVTTHDLEDIKAVALANFDRNNPVFKVETKRSYKQFPMTSQEVSRAVGAHILINNNGLDKMRVDVRNPEQLLQVEIQQNRAFVFHTTERAMGGLPIGTAGKGLVLLSGGIDSPVAAVEAMKRGLKIDCIHFSSPPYTNEQSLQKVKDLAKVLQKYDKDIKLYNAHFTEIQVAIHDHCADKYEVTILRRMMLRQASLLAKKLKATVLVTGESLGQVASQTISSMNVTNQTVDNLIIRPLITMDKLQIIELAKKIGTYEISILPFEDCCVVFLPKNPSTNPKLDEVIKEEERFDYMSMINETQLTKDNYKSLQKKKRLIDDLI